MDTLLCDLGLWLPMNCSLLSIQFDSYYDASILKEVQDCSRLPRTAFFRKLQVHEQVGVPRGWVVEVLDSASLFLAARLLQGW